MTENRMFAILLCLIILVMGTSSVCADEVVIASGTCGTDLTWKLVGSTLTIAGSGDMENYALELKLPRWLAYYNMIDEVIIEEGITSIGNSAFTTLSYLRSVMIPNSVTSIGEDAFNGCSSLTSIIIPDRVTSIGDGAFNWCESLQSVSIPDSVTSIGDFAFYHCDSLRSVTIPKHVTSIGECALGCFSYQESTMTHIEGHPRFTISGYLGSEAERYAEVWELRFEALDDPALDDAWERKTNGDIIKLGVFISAAALVCGMILGVASARAKKISRNE